MKNKNSGFTLAEVLIVIGLLGIIAALTTPMIMKVMPNKEEELFKKMTYSVQNIVSQMHSDEAMYPKTGDFARQDFRNTNSVNIKGIDYKGNTKFCELFASRFEKTSSEVNCFEYDDEHKLDVIEPFTKDYAPSFETSDHVQWYLNADDFSKGYTTIIIDVNGAECPNTTDLETMGKDSSGNICSGKFKTPDRKKFYIRDNGTVVDEKPNENSTQDVFSIKVDIICNDGTTNCGNIVIADYYGNNADGNYDTDKVDGFAFKNRRLTNSNNLKKGHTYVLAAVPNDNYYSGWSNIVPGETEYKSDDDDTDHDPTKYYENSGAISTKTNIGFKKIKIDGSVQIVNTTVRISKKELHTLTLEINDCVEDNFENCIDGNISLKRYPKWKTTENVGSVDGTALSDTYTITLSPNTTIENLPSGNYQLKMKTKWPYAIFTSLTGYDYEITKDIKIGTEDITMTIDLDNSKIQLHKISDNSDGPEIKIKNNSNTAWDESNNEYTKQTGTTYCETGYTECWCKDSDCYYTD